jgi:hypothetical protein
VPSCESLFDYTIALDRERKRNLTYTERKERETPTTLASTREERELLKEFKE